MMNIVNKIHDNAKHGQVFSPKSRAQFLVEAGKLSAWQANELEGGKFFPETQAGLSDPSAPDDVLNDLPPPDGKIASGGRSDERDQLNEARADWPKHAVKSGQVLDIAWSYMAAHKTRRWNYFITKDGWNPNQPLARSQFEPAPFARHLNAYRPYWGPDADRELLPPDPTRHQVTLPQKKGYHVILAVWEVADTGNGFYQIIDVDFG